MKQLSTNKIFAGEQHQYEHHSDCLNCDMQFSIYLPPQAENATVPVLYWLSGLTCTDQNFVTKAGAQQFAAEHGIAIVCPDTSPRGELVPDGRRLGFRFRCRLLRKCHAKPMERALPDVSICGGRIACID